MQHANMVMHVNENLGEPSRRIIERSLTERNGVLDAHFNEKRPHLVLVSYDTERTSSFDILSDMSGQHLCAERIG